MSKRPRKVRRGLLEGVDENEPMAVETLGVWYPVEK
jgi:hypothetical protein